MSELALIVALIACGQPGDKHGKRGDLGPDTRESPEESSLVRDAMAIGCSRESPATTKAQCREWAVGLLEYQRSDWDIVAREMLLRLCEQGCGDCCEKAADLVGRAVGGRSDVAQEQDLRRAACALGVRAQCDVSVRAVADAESLERKGLRGDCESGAARSCLEYGKRLWDHDRDPDGQRYFERACSLGSRVGCTRAAAARDALKGLGPW